MVEEQGIDATAGGADIVDGRAASAELRPGALPESAELEAVAGRAGGHHRDEQHRRGAGDLAGDAQQLPGPRPVEHHAEPGDVAVRADLLLLDDDAGDDRRQRRFGEVRRLADRAIVGPRPEHPPAEQLGAAPALGSRRLTAGRADVDLDAANLEIGRAVIGIDAAIGAVQLGERGAAEQEGQRHHRNQGGKWATQEPHARLLASWPWKSKQVLGRREP